MKIVFYLGCFIVVAAICANLALKSDPTLKLRVAVGLFGWEGLMSIAKVSIGERIIGHKATKSREAWHELLDTLADVELKYLSPSRGFTTAEDIAEGHRLLSHILKAGFEFQLEKEELRPHFGQFPTRTRKLLGDNPDAEYYMAAINPEYSYKVSGSLQGEDYLSFTLAEAPCHGCFSNAVIGDINNFDMSMEEDGKAFELYIGKEKPQGAKNWLAVQPGSASRQLQIVSRHYFEHAIHVHNDLTLVPNVSIEIIGEVPPTGKSRFRSDKWMEDRLQRVQKFVIEHTVNMKNDPVNIPPWFSLEPNVLGPPLLYRGSKNRKEAGGGLGAVDIVYSAGPFKLPAGKALRMEAKIPASCKFVNVNLWNRYLQTFNYADRQVSLNRKQMRIEKDGFVSIILSPVKPSDPKTNWLDSEKRDTGTIFWRFVLCESEIQHVNLTEIDCAAV